MNRVRFEGTVLNALERVTRRQPVEDAQIELKAEWIDFRKAARRLAAHANSASGAAIIWIVGVDEKGAKVVGASAKELSAWFQQVQNEFDELSPALLDHLAIPNTYGQPVVALMFDTSRAPYAVKVPQTPKAGYAQPEVEFPWRDATRTRSAKRSELLAVLAGNRLIPDVEELEAWLGVEEEVLSTPDGPVEVNTWNFEGAAYFVPRDERPVSIPFHQSRAVAEFESGVQLTFTEMRLGPETIPGPFVYQPAVNSPVTSSAPLVLPSAPLKKESEAYLASPSKLVLTGRLIVEAGTVPIGEVRVKADLGVAGTRALLSLAWNLVPWTLAPTNSRRPYASEWVSR